MNSSVVVDNFARRTVPILLLVYPVLLLSVRGGMSACLVLLFLISLHCLFQFGWRNIIHWRPGDMAFAIAMASLIAATLLSQVYHRTFGLGALDGPLRFALVIPIYLTLRCTPLSFPRALEYGLPLGVLAALITSIFFPSTYWTLQGTYFVDPAMFGGAIVILGFLSVGAINWTRRDPPAVLALKLAGFVVGIFCAIQSTERGVWIAIPILIILWARYRFSLKGSVAIAAIALVVALAGYGLIPGIHNRIAETQMEMVSALNGNFDTSVGARLQIWKASAKIIWDNPIVGVGPMAVSDELQALSHSGWITPFGLQAGLSQIHNEILANTIRLGIFGLLSILAIYLVPLALFIKATASVDRVKHTAGVMGMLFVTGYFVFGLTVETFNIKMFATFYAVTVAALLATARHSASFTIDGWKRWGSNSGEPAIYKSPKPVGGVRVLGGPLGHVELQSEKQ
jgi:O-antigen ligase